MTTTGLFLLAILALGFLITFQIAKASEYVSVLKERKKSFEQNNRINGFLMVVFLVLGIIGVYWCNEALYPKTLMPYPSASEHGENIDTMLKITHADHRHRIFHHPDLIILVCLQISVQR